MTEPFFQRDLLTLKKRVSELSSKQNLQSRIMPVPTTTNTATKDPFADQMSDILNRLHSVEQSMRDHRRSMQQRLETPPASQGTAGASSGSGASSNPQMLQLSALLRQVHDQSLSRQKTLWERLDVLERNAQDEKSALENRLNELDNRIDNLEPTLFTPATSAAATETGACDPSFRNEYAAPFTQPSAPVCELYSDSNNFQGQAPAGTGQPRDSEIQSTNYSYYNHWLPTPAYSYQPPPPSDNEAFLRSRVELLVQKNKTIEQNVNRLHEENTRLVTMIQSLLQRSGPGTHLHEAGDAETSAKPWVYSAAGLIASPEGVDFRNREISRLDEQLRIAHERLKADEADAAQKDAQIEQLRGDVQALQNGVQQDADTRRKTEDELNWASSRLVAKDSELRDLMHQLAERDDTIGSWEHSWHRQNDELRHWRDQVMVLDRRCREEKNEKRTALIKAKTEHEEDLKKLKEFCEQKDAVLKKQQDNIGWAGQLLEQRDAELEDMQRKLRTVQDDREHAVRTMERVARLLGERDAELARFRRETDVARIETGEWERQDASVVRMPPRRTGYSVDSRDARPDDRPERDDFTGRWDPPSSPRPQPAVPQFSPEPEDKRDEESQPFVWDDRVNGFVRQEPAAPKSPQVSEVSHENEKKRRGRHSGRHRRTSHRHYPELDKAGPSNPAQTPDVRGWEPAPIAKANLVPPRFRQSVDDTSFQPPLPVPVTARRMASEADLRSASPRYVTQRRNHDLAKHRSMMELHPRRLQAYVETEAESGDGDFAGEV